MSIAMTAERLQTLLSERAEHCARASGCVQRQRVLSGAMLVQTLVIGFWLHPRATLHQLSQIVARLGGTISPQGMAQRCTPALVDCLSQVLGEVSSALGTRAVGVSGVLSRFNGVVVLDTTSISLPAALADEFPGCGGGNGGGEAAIKLAVLLELGSAQVLELERCAGRTQDRAVRLQDLRLPAGSLRLADLGFFTLRVFADIGAQGGYWLSRWRVKTALFTADGVRVTQLERWLQRQAVQGVVDCWVEVGVEARLPARLIAVRVSKAVALKRRLDILTEAAKKRQQPSQARLALVGWTVLLTNAGAELLTVEEALVLQRARWQIELLFKSWKSQAQLATCVSVKPERVLAELYAKLIAITLQHQVLAAVGFRGIEQSLTKAVQTIQDYLGQLLQALGRSRRAVQQVLRDLGRCLRAGCQMETRRGKPRLAQLLENPSLTYSRGLT